MAYVRPQVALSAFCLLELFPRHYLFSVPRLSTLMLKIHCASLLPVLQNHISQNNNDFSAQNSMYGDVDVAILYL
jgi:hypothetical protein